MSRAPRTSPITFAASVLPTPASPSMNRGFSSFRARKIAVARARSPMYWRSRRRASTSSIVIGPPLVTCKRVPAASPWPAAGECVSAGLLDRPLGEDPGEVLLVLRARPEVAGWVQPVGRVLGGLLRLGALAEGVLHGFGAHRCRPDVGEADPPVAVDLLGGRADD